MEQPNEFKRRAADCVAFLNKSRDPFHAVDSVRKLLTDAGFVELKEKDSWDKLIVKGGKYWYYSSDCLLEILLRVWLQGSQFRFVTSIGLPEIKVRVLHFVLVTNGKVEMAFQWLVLILIVLVWYIFSSLFLCYFFQFLEPSFLFFFLLIS